MPGKSHQPSTATNRRHRSVGAACILAAISSLVPACDSRKSAAKPDDASPAAKPATNQPARAIPELTAARLELAATRMATDAPDEALAMVVAALEADPESARAAAMARDILTKTRWHVPEVTLEHHLRIDRIDFAEPSSLWVSLADDSNTTVRWNLESLAIESTLFPTAATATRSLVFDPTHRSVVVERGGVTLLCNAQSLKPVRDLGPLPDFVTPSAAIAFSSDGLLVAHPTFAAANKRAVVWNLRDTASGEILRASEPSTPDRPRPLAAFLDRKTLRVLSADGSLMEIPVSPVDPVRTIPPERPLNLLHAQFATDGGSALALKDPGPHQSPDLFVLALGGNASTSLEPACLLKRFPWSRNPDLWTDLWRNADHPPLKVDDRTARILIEPRPPIHTGSSITALAANDDRLMVGETSGTLTILRTLPLPTVKPNAAQPKGFDAKSLAALRQLATALTGIRYSEATRSFTTTATTARLAACADCDFNALLRVFPTLDFSQVAAAMGSIHPRSAAPESLVPLWDRLARADSSGTSWPRCLERAAELAHTTWHQQLTAAVVARASKRPVNPEASPWLASLGVERSFETGDSNTIATTIQAAGGKGPAAAKALELSLASTHPEWIGACLSRAANVPPMLRRLAVSRIAWLQNRKVDALAGWPDVFPELAQVRLREDWDGWEQADFSQALENLRLCVGEVLASIDVPPNPTAEQRKTIAARLSDPATIQAVGRARFASACLKAALAFAAFKEEKENTFILAARARDLGEAAAPCLRAEAMALTALGDYQTAHDRWITLITEFPVDAQLPGDYAEASYTSFENADPRQAMAILTTGLHRFPKDANFALRAGWVALLTGNAERAYRFLLTGQQIGYPPEKLENATALLAIAAMQTGAAEDAAAYYEDLIVLDPEWKNPETLESLEWPEELKASLRQVASPDLTPDPSLLPTIP